MASPKTITPSKTWAPADVQPLAKPWETTKGGDEVRQNNCALAPQVLCGAANHTFAYQPRVTFARAWPFAQRQTSSEDPLCLWYYSDDVTNARDQQFRILHVPKTSGTTDGYAFRYGAATTKTPDTNLTIGSPSFPDDVFEQRIDYARGDADGGAIEEGVSTANYSITDIVVQDQPTTHLDTNAHLFASASGVAPGRPVIANWLNQLRFDWHQHRTTNLPIWWPWVAFRDTSAWATPGGTANTGLVSVDTTLTNVIDETSTSRTTTSPGTPPIDVYRCGRGLETSDDGTKYPVLVVVLADATDTGTLRAIGPDHVASNSVDISITTAGPDWFVASSPLYLNTAVDVTDTTSERNKIDFLLNHSAGNTTYVYAIGLVGLYELT